MEISRVSLSASEVAQLAVLLHEAGYTRLAQRIGHAFDSNLRELPLTNRDAKPIRDVLASVSEGSLTRLREALRDERSIAAHHH